MHTRHFRSLILTLSSVALITSALTSARPVSAQTNIFTDLASFEAATGPLTEIDFENLPFDEGYLPNPLTLGGVTFTDAYTLQSGFCSSPTCQPDPDNPIGGNVVLYLNVDGTIDFPAGTGGVMLVVEGMGDAPYAVQVTDFGGNTITAQGQGVLFGIEYLGFTSVNGIRRIKVVSTGPTPDCPSPRCGPLVLSAIYVELNDPDVALKVWSDPLGDVTSANGDLIYGSASISDGLVDLRLQFVAPPFSTDNTQHITWCFDTDQKPATGQACDFGSARGADRVMTLSGGPHAMAGDDFSLTGSLGILDPCAIGAFNWDLNVLRLVFPAAMLSDDGVFNYAVRSTLGDAVEQAPDTADFGAASGYFSSQVAEFPFSGSPLCSFEEETSMTIMPQQTGYARHFPELGVRDASPGSGVQSRYRKTTAVNREFRRGLFEFALPEIQKPIVNAILIYEGDLGFPSDSPAPTIVHELSYHQPADLVIDMADYDRPTTFLGLVETDLNWARQAFAVDVTDLVRQYKGDTLGFRIKLAVDPDYDEIGGVGWAFGISNYRPPQIVVQFVDAKTTMVPTMDSTLVYTDAQGNVTDMFVPANTVTQTTELLYTEQAASVAAGAGATSVPVSAAAATLGEQMTMAGRPFTLDGYQDGTFTPGSIIQKPITATLRYSDYDVSGISEDTLTLYYWSGSGWEHAGCGPYERHPDENWLAIPVCHLDEFTLFGLRDLDAQAYLPVILKR